MIVRETAVVLVVPKLPATPPPPPRLATPIGKQIPLDIVVAILLVAALVAFVFGFAIGRSSLTNDKADAIQNLGPGPNVQSGPPPARTITR